jgi:hypothetical protein
LTRQEGGLTLGVSHKATPLLRSVGLPGSGALFLGAV